jgi:hypothetical protein
MTIFIHMNSFIYFVSLWILLIKKFNEFNPGYFFSLASILYRFQQKSIHKFFNQLVNNAKARWDGVTALN